MGVRTRIALTALGGAAILGVLGDLLLRASPWGINVLLWTVALVVAVAGVARWARVPLVGEGRWLVAPLLFFAGALAWRNSPTLIGANLLALLMILALAAHRTRMGSLRIAGVMEYLGAGVVAFFYATVGLPLLLLGDVKWSELPRVGWSGPLLAVTRGLVIAVPLLLVFGTLFVAADAIFAGLVSDVLAFDLKEIVAHLFWIGLWGWLSAGFLRHLLLLASDAASGTAHAFASGAPEATSEGGAVDGDSPFGAAGEDGGILGAEVDDDALGAVVDAGGAAAVALPQTAGSESLSGSESVAGTRAISGSAGRAVRAPLFALGIVEVGIVLGLLDLLFLAFVLVQFRYLFGGAAQVEVSPTLTYAEYARRGFFELVAVAALLLPILLGLDALARARTPQQVWLYRILAGILILLLFVVMASALQRMRLYQQTYGLTELRLYTTAFMGWLGLIAAWFLATVLRGRRDRFMFGAFVTGCLVLVTLNAVNPDDLIVRTNASRDDAAEPIDGHYLTQLSADAVPAIIEVLPNLPESERSLAAAWLLWRWSPPDSIDWRTWHWGRWQAWQTVADNAEMLREVKGDTVYPPTYTRR